MGLFHCQLRLAKIDHDMFNTLRAALRPCEVIRVILYNSYLI